MPISHKHLLEKYIDHVTRCEGMDFVTHAHALHVYRSDVKFTADEVEFFERTQRMLDAGQTGGARVD